MIIAEGISIAPEIAHAQFACDVAACKGACCTVPGGRGAPVREDEVTHLERAAALLGPELSARHQEVLKNDGPTEGVTGSRFTVCVDGGACVFVIVENGIAACAIERAYMHGRFPWRKPVSCHLYPIRVDHGPQEHLRYEVVEACAPAVERGAREGISLLDFTGDALRRAYGDNFVAAVHHAASRPPASR